MAKKGKFTRISEKASFENQQIKKKRKGAFSSL
jgi:hypothetical protein